MDINSLINENIYDTIAKKYIDYYFYEMVKVDNRKNVFSYFIAYKTKIPNLKLFKLLLNYSFGIYLYSDPMNYLILFLGNKFIGSVLFTSAYGIIGLYFNRILITFLISILITFILKKIKYIC